MINPQESQMKQIAGVYLREFESLLHKVDLDAFERIARRSFCEHRLSMNQLPGKKTAFPIGSFLAKNLGREFKA